MDETELSRLRQAVQAAPQDDDARLTLLQALIASARWQEAVEAGEPWGQADAPTSEAHVSLAIAYGKLARWEETEAQCRRGLDLRPDDVLLRYNLGAALAQRGEDAAAIEALEEVVTQQEDWAEAHFNLGVVLLRQSRYESALDAFEQATENREDYAEAYFGLGNTYAVQGLDQDGYPDYSKIDRAITAYQQAINKRPGYAAALYNLGMLYGRLDAQEGLRTWDRYLEAAGDSEAEEVYCMRAREYKRDLQDRLR